MPFSVRTLAISWAGIWLLTAAPCGPALAAPPGGPLILTKDVTRFYQIYDSSGAHPTANQLDHSYIDQGSDGLRQFAKLRNVSGATIVEAIKKRPEIYADARRCLTALPAVKRRLTAAFGKLAQLYPEANFAPVTVLVGRGKPIGITNAAGVSIGLEALCAANFMEPDIEDRVVHTIAHDFVLEVSDPVAAAHFLRDLLDFISVRLDEYRSGSAPFPSVRITERLVVDLFPPRMWSGDQPRNPNHVCFAMPRERFEAVAAKLQEQSIPVTKTDEHNFGARGWGHSLYFDGPNGVSIEIRHYSSDRLGQ